MKKIMGYIVMASLLAVANLSRAEEAVVEFQALADGVWMYTYDFVLESGVAVPSNGVIAIAEDEAVIIDLPDKASVLEELFQWVTERGAKVKYVVPQHFHADSAGDLPLAKQLGAAVVMLDKTVALIPPQRRVPADIVFQDRLLLAFGGRQLELAHFGGGHTVDSVVAWLAAEKILVGGCLIKSARAKSLGNIADADLPHYESTLIAIKEAYQPLIVTPGHGSVGDASLLDHTVELRKALQQ